MKKEEKEDLISRKEFLGAIRMYLEKRNLGEITSRTDLSIGEIASIISDIPSVENFEKQSRVCEKCICSTCIENVAMRRRSIKKEYSCQSYFANKI